MVTLGLICIFLSFILVIMGLLAWGSMQPKEPEQPPAGDAEMKAEPETVDSEDKL